MEPHFQPSVQPAAPQVRVAHEIVATAQIFHHATRLRSFEIAAEVFAALPNAVEVLSMPA